VTFRIAFTRLAKRDLDELIVFIGEKNPRAAVDIAARIFGRIDLLQDQPALGRPGRRSGTRELIVDGTLYLVAYRIETSAPEVRILRILHSSRRWPRKL
jgi:plasmid stabilization system protein ParE